MVSFDDIPRFSNNESKMSYPDISNSFKKPLGRVAPLVKQPDKVETIAKNYKEKFKLDSHINNIRDYLYSCELEGPGVKFLTIRPHDEFMFGRYNITNRIQAVSVFKRLLKDKIPYPFIGSIEENNKIFIHCHLIVLCSNKKLDILVQRLKDDFTIQHKLTGKQYAIMKQRPQSPADRLFMIRYYLGLKYDFNSKKFYSKPSYLYNIVNQWPIRLYNEEVAKGFKEMFDIFLQNKKTSSIVYDQRINHQKNNQCQKIQP